MTHHKTYTEQEEKWGRRILLCLEGLFNVAGYCLAWWMLHRHGFDWWEVSVLLLAFEFWIKPLRRDILLRAWAKSNKVKL